MIYVINMRGTPYYKIGYTEGDPEKRKAQLQTGSPTPLDLVVSVTGDRAMEAALHRDWKKYQSDANNEWMILQREQLEKLLRHGLKIKDGHVAMEGEMWPITTTFHQWLQKQAERDDPIGDFARDTLEYVDWTGGDCPLPDDRAGHQEWKNFLWRNGACDGAILAFEEGWREFMYSTKKIRR